MDKRNRRILVGILSALVVFAVFASFLIPYLINLPPSVQLSADSPGTGTPDTSLWQTDLVEIRPDTVQAAIASLRRPARYHRTLQLRLYWGETDAMQSAATTVSVWQDGDYQAIERSGPDGVVQHSLLTPQEAYLWYGAERSPLRLPKKDALGDILQGIPSYEDLLALPTSRIRQSSFAEKNGKACLYVEVVQENPAYTERFWVDTDSGLLIASESQSAERLLYTMEETGYTTTLEEGYRFSLPQGKVLHQVS